MTSVQLEAFVAAVEEGSFSAGARRLYITPQALMHQVTSLEAELGFKLLERNAHGVAVTPAGGTYYANAKQMLSFMDSAKAQGRQVAEGRRTLCFAHCGGYMEHNHCLLDLAGAIAAEHPGIEQRHIFAEGPEQDILARVATGEIDLLEWISSPGIDLRGMGFFPLSPCAPTVLVSPSHQLAGRGDAIEVEDLAGCEVSISDRYWFPALVRDIRALTTEATVVERGCGGMSIANVCMNGGVFVVWDLPDDTASGNLVRLRLPERYDGTFGVVHNPSPTEMTLSALAIAGRMFGEGRSR